MIDWMAKAVDLLRRHGAGGEDLGIAPVEAGQGLQQAVAWVRLAHERGHLTDAARTEVLAGLFGVPVRARIALDDVDRGFLASIPIRFARRHRVIGVRTCEDALTVVTDTLEQTAVLDHIGLVLETPVIQEIAPPETIDEVINQAYAQLESNFSEVIGGTPEDTLVIEGAESEDEGDLLDNAARAPVVKLVNMMLFEAVKRRVSDVHIQPFPSVVQIRYRIDGVLYDYLEVPRHMLDEIVGRIKVIGKMDIAEKRLAQDGRTTVSVGDKSIDLRISVIPTSCGERTVIRLLDKSARLYELKELGMSAADHMRFERLLHQTHGIVLVTGPTGSGKSTTLYAALQYLDCKEKNILTLEDPIEYQLPGISQTQVSSKKGMTFASGLRTVLRQDPDIIMVGEIRDEETARMAIQSSLTGHLVFSTLHTNDAPGATSRLLDLGIEPYLVASSLLAVLAQRLVRIVCPRCARDVPLSKTDSDVLQIDPTLHTGLVKSTIGCDQCAMTGYRERRGIFELLVVDEAVRQLIVVRAKSSEIKSRGMQSGMTTLRQDGVRKILAGETTPEEVARVTCQDESIEEALVAPAMA